MGSRILNKGEGRSQSCDVCQDCGWVYLNRTPLVRSSFMRNGSVVEREYNKAGELAPCGFCERGHGHHDQYPYMPWEYKVEEIDSKPGYVQASKETVAACMVSIRESLQRLGERAMLMENEGTGPDSTPNPTVEEVEGS